MKRERAEVGHKEGRRGTKKNVAGYRLGLYDPVNARQRVRFIGRVYQCTREDSVLLRETIAEFNELASRTQDSFLCLSAFPVKARQRR